MANKEDKKNSNSSWRIKNLAKSSTLNLKDSVLIEGLPGIANVGKIAIDFIIAQKKAKKIAEFLSYDLPHSVFIKENNLVELPKIELYLLNKTKKMKDNLLLLSGDVQPSNERPCYEFCEMLIDYTKKLGCKEIVTTGGIGLPKIPKSPKIYCTANNKQIIKKYKEIVKINDKTYGVVGPIVGVTGLLVGIASEHKIPAIALLTETFAHPMYLGMSSARNLLNVLNQMFCLEIDMNNLDKEIEDLENEIMSRVEQLKQIKDNQGKKDHKLNYIG